MISIVAVIHILMISPKTKMAEDALVREGIGYQPEIGIEQMQVVLGNRI